MDYTLELDQINKLDALINNSARLMLVFLLSRYERLDYIELMQHTNLSSGNLTTHLQKLLSAGYLSRIKSFIDNKPNSSYQITELGFKAYEQWGEQILMALPQGSERLLRNKILNEVQRGYNHHREWFSEQFTRFSFFQPDRGLRLLPPVTEAYL